MLHPLTTKTPNVPIVDTVTANRLAFLANHPAYSGAIDTKHTTNSPNPRHLTLSFAFVCFASYARVALSPWDLT